MRNEPICSEHDGHDCDHEWGCGDLHERDAKIAELEAALRACVEGMQGWARDEDGLHYAAWDGYVEAHLALGLPTPTTEGSEIECPCCGNVGAVSNARGMYEDGQDLVCGCAGQVTFDAETEPWICICDVTPCEHGTPTTEGSDG